jgi:hypothetical protein
MIPECIRGTWSVSVLINPEAWALNLNGVRIAEFGKQEMADALAAVLNAAQPRPE